MDNDTEDRNENRLYLDTSYYVCAFICVSPYISYVSFDYTDVGMYVYLTHKQIYIIYIHIYV